jgi:hypothetical protein
LCEPVVITTWRLMRAGRWPSAPFQSGSSNSAHSSRSRRSSFIGRPCTASTIVLSKFERTVWGVATCVIVR